MKTDKQKEEYRLENLDEYESKIFYSRLRLKLNSLRDDEDRQRAEDMKSTLRRT